MKGKLLTAVLALSLVAGPAAAIDLGDVWKDGLNEQYPKVNSTVAENLDFSASETKISQKTGLFDSFFSIVTGSGETGPGDEVTFETTVNINDWQTSCDNYIAPEGIQFSVWLEGEGVSKSDTKDTVYVSCYGDGTADKSIDFNVPKQDGTFDYDFKAGVDYYDAISGNDYSWEQTVETDSVEVHVEPLEAKIDSTDTETVVGESILFSGDESQGFGGIDDYEWYVDGDQVGTGRTLDHEFDRSGEKEIKLRVSDYAWRDDYLGETRWDSTTITIDVVGDEDGDGIPDPQDECDDTEGTEEFDGCPNPDPDGDGVEDDDCPEEPGQLENGCPNEEPQIKRASVTPDPAVVGETVELEIRATDLNNQDLVYKTFYNGKRKIGPNPSFSFKSSGTKTLNIEVSDGLTSVEKSVDVQVTELQTDPVPIPENETEDDTTGEDNSGEGEESTPEDLGTVERIFFGFINWLTGGQQ